MTTLVLAWEVLGMSSRKSGIDHPFFGSAGAGTVSRRRPRELGLDNWDHWVGMIRLAKLIESCRATVLRFLPTWQSSTGGFVARRAPARVADSSRDVSGAEDSVLSVRRTQNCSTPFTDAKYLLRALRSSTWPSVGDRSEGIHTPSPAESDGKLAIDHICIMRSRLQMSRAACFISRERSASC